jgi:hypothetical protein
MNLLEAKRILELPESWNEDILKQNYRRLAMKYHPDKCKDPDSHDHFTKINEAHQFMERKPQNPINIQIIDLVKLFGTSFLVPEKIKPIEIEITIKEYFTGVTKYIKEVCPRCAGCGFGTCTTDISFCTRCKGDGSIKLGDLTLDKCMDLSKSIQMSNFKVTVVLNDKKYSYLENKIYYRFNISLKESLIGFNKIFKDPFGDSHTLNINQVPIKPGDGYLISTLNVKIVLLFNIIYPKNNFLIDTINLIRQINF